MSTFLPLALALSHYRPSSWGFPGLDLVLQLINDELVNVGAKEADGFVHG